MVLYSTSLALSVCTGFAVFLVLDDPFNLTPFDYFGQFEVMVRGGVTEAGERTKRMRSFRRRVTGRLTAATPEAYVPSAFHPPRACHWSRAACRCSPCSSSPGLVGVHCRLREMDVSSPHNHHARPPVAPIRCCCTLWTRCLCATPLTRTATSARSPWCTRYTRTCRGESAAGC